MSAVPEGKWGFLARRLAAGANLIELAVSEGVPIVDLRALKEDPDFSELIGVYAARMTLSDEEKRAYWRQLFEDCALDLIEKRNAATVHLAMRQVGLFSGQGSRAIGDSAPCNEPRQPDFFNFDDYYDQLSPEWQADYRRFSPDYVPSDERDPTIEYSACGEPIGPKIDDVQARDLDETGTQAMGEEVTTDQRSIALNSTADDSIVDASEAEAGRGSMESSHATGSPRTSEPANANRPQNLPPGFTYWRKQPLPSHYRIRAP